MNWFMRLGAVINRATGWDRTITSTRIITPWRTQAGVHIDGDNAFKNATVWACNQYLTKTVGQLPWHAYLPAANGNAEVASAGGVDHLINVRPNPEMGAMTWRQVMLGHALMRGNGYSEIQRDQRGIPVALWPLHPDRVVARRRQNGALYFEVWNSGGNTELDAMDMFHLRGFGDGVLGLDVVSYAAESIGWAQATEIFGSTFFGNGMNPSAVITTSAGLSPAGLDEMRKEADRLYAGPKGKRTAIFDASAKYEKISTNPNDGQFIETRQHQVEEICRWFGVPPHKVMHLLRATFSNIEHQSIEVVVDSITPWARLFEQEANYKLFGASNRQGFYTKMSVQALMRGDNASRMAFYKGLFELGVPLNQILALEEIDNIGADGNVSFVSNNVQTLRRAIEGKPTKTVPAPGDTIPDDDEPETTEPERPSNGVLLNRA